MDAMAWVLMTLPNEVQQVASSFAVLPCKLARLANLLSPTSSLGSGGILRGPEQRRCAQLIKGW